TPAEIMAAASSLTGQYLSGTREIAVPETRRPGNGWTLSIKGARLNNLRNVSVDIPLGKITCVTGVSGSGKSSLVIDTLYKALAKELYNAGAPVGEVDAIEGIGL